MKLEMLCYQYVPMYFVFTHQQKPVALIPCYKTLNGVCLFADINVFFDYSDVIAPDPQIIPQCVLLIAEYVGSIRMSKVREESNLWKFLLHPKFGVMVQYDDYYQPCQGEALL